MGVFNKFFEFVGVLVKVVIVEIVRKLFVGFDEVCENS